MSKKFWPALIVTFILLFLMEWILHGRLMMNIYEGASSIILPQSLMLSRLMWMALGYLFLAIFWTYFFARFSSRKDPAKGIFWGIVIMVFFKVPNALIWYAIIPLSGWAYLWSIIGGLVEGVVIGAIMGMLMREKAAA